MFSALAPPAANAPPATVNDMSRSDGTWWAATNMVGTVVMSRSSMIRGLVRAT